MARSVENLPRCSGQNTASAMITAPDASVSTAASFAGEGEVISPWQVA
jgi:hypothetical protein